ncbi:hypothetical protein ACFVSS_09775 [Peribacillus butanolivorans]
MSKMRQLLHEVTVNGTARKAYFQRIISVEKLERPMTLKTFGLSD